MKHSFEKFIEENRNGFEEWEPGEHVFEQCMERFHAISKPKQVFVLKITLKHFWIAASLMMAVSTWYFLYFNSEKHSEKTLSDFVKKQSSVANNSNLTINEVIKNPPVLTFSEKKKTGPNYTKILTMASASQRLSTLKKWESIKKADKKFIDLLIQILNKDPSTNVRLVSLESLMKFSDESYVRNKLIQSLSKQNDPMVQIALIRCLTDLREASIIGELELIAENGTSIEAVKTNAYEGIIKIKM